MIRSYSEDDQSAVLDLIRLNTPEFFDASEEKDLKDYLEHSREDYFVFEKEGQVIGATGINYELGKKAKAILSWDLIHPDFQGMGIGRQLTHFRINHIKAQEGYEVIVVRTSQLTYPFYEKMGFKLINMKKDYWAPGYDLYFMEQKL